MLLLTVFLSVNLALIAIKRRDTGNIRGFRIPIVVPVIAAIACAVLICFVPLKSLLSGTIVIAFGVALVLTRIMHQPFPPKKESISS